MFSLILFMVITIIAFVFFNGVAVKPLLHLLRITNETSQLKRETREWVLFHCKKLIHFNLSLYITKGKELFENYFESSKYG